MSTNRKDFLKIALAGTLGVEYNVKAAKKYLSERDKNFFD
jgi:hypothetical protein